MNRQNPTLKKLPIKEDTKGRLLLGRRNRSKPSFEYPESSNELRMAFEVHPNKFEVPIRLRAKNFEYLRILAEANFESVRITSHESGLTARLTRLMPGKPFQSKLEPFLETIRQWRCQRWSYPRIAEALHKEHGMTVAPSTIFSFVKVRAKGRKYSLCRLRKRSIKPQLSPLSAEIRQRSTHFSNPKPTQTMKPQQKDPITSTILD